MAPKIFTRLHFDFWLFSSSWLFFFFLIFCLNPHSTRCEYFHSLNFCFPACFLLTLLPLFRIASQHVFPSLGRECRPAAVAPWLRWIAVPVVMEWAVAIGQQPCAQPTTTAETVWDRVHIFKREKTSDPLAFYPNCTGRSAVRYGVI